MTRGVSETLQTKLPAKFEQLFAWKLDRRSSTVREFAGDLQTLWSELGGVDELSAQKRWLCERAVFLRRRMLLFESAVMAGTELPFTGGEYSNYSNVMLGHLKALGLERKARNAQGLGAWLAGKTAPVSEVASDAG